MVTASSTSCVIASDAMPSSRDMPQYQLRMSARVSASSALNGSSRSVTSFPIRYVRRKAARWRMPPESSLGHMRSVPERPKRSNSGSAFARASRAGVPAITSGRHTLSSIRLLGSSRSFCSM